MKTNIIKKTVSVAAAIVCLCSVAISASADAQKKTPVIVKDAEAECVTTAEDIPVFTGDDICEVSAIAESNKAPKRLDDTEGECSTQPDDRDVSVGDEANGEVLSSVIVCGDVNGDGVLNISDIAAISAHVRGIKVLEDISAADMNNDGVITVTDVVMASAIIKGMI